MYTLSLICLNLHQSLHSKLTLWHRNVSTTRSNFLFIAEKNEKRIEFRSIACHKLTKVFSPRTFRHIHTHSIWNKRIRIRKKRKNQENDRKGIYYIFTFVYCFGNIIINLSSQLQFHYFCHLPSTQHPKNVYLYLY